MSSCRKELGAAHQSQARYLFSGQYRDGQLVAGSVKPLPHQLLAVAAERPRADGKGSQWVTQLWGTNHEGYLDRLDNRFELADRVRDLRLGDPLPFLALPLAEVATLVATQSGNWQQALAAALPVEELQRRLTDQQQGAPCRLQRVTTDLLQRHSEGDDSYRCWFQQVEGRVLEGWVLPRQRAVVVAFSSLLFDRAEVNLWPEGSNFKTYAAETVVRGEDPSGNAVYAVTFVPGADDPALESGFFRIRVSLADGISLGGADLPLDEGGRFYYEFTEKLRFDIHNLAGEFSFINGDPQWLEESILKQFPQLYRGHIQSARALSQSGSASTSTGLAAYAHDFGVRHSATALASSVLGSESPEARFWAYGQFIQAAVGYKGSDEAKHLMAAVYDTKSAVGKIRDYLAAERSNSHGLNAAGEAKIRDYLANQWFDANEGWLKETKAKTLKVFNFQLPTRYVNFFNQAMAVYEQGVGAAAIWDAGLAYARARDTAEANRDLHGQILEDYATCVGEPVDETFTALNDALRRLADHYDGKHGVERSELARAEGRLTARLALFFDTAEDELPGLDLQAVADLLLEHPEARAQLIGHADQVGSEAFNMALSQRRAEKIEQRLLACGGDRADALAARVSCSGRGSQDATLAEGGRDDRRVDLVVTMPATETRYWASREGLQNLERSRARTEHDRLQLEASAKAALGALYDSAIGLGMLFPGTAQVAGALAVVESGAKAARSAAMVVDDLLFDQALDGFLKQLKLEGDLQQRARANRRDIRFANEKQSAGEALNNQLRIRADVINGLVGLINRASYDACEQGQSGDERRQAFERALKAYKVDDYIRLFVFADSWHYPSSPYYNLSMDQYWLDYLGSPDDRFRLFKQAPDSISQEKYRAYVEEINEREREQLAQAGMGISGALAMPSTLLADHPDAITVNFQKSFPIHGLSSESLDAFYQDIDLSYGHLDTSMYDFTEVRFRPRGSRLNDPWLTVAEWEESVKRPLSFLDQVRVIVVLNEGHSTLCPLTLKPVREALGHDDELTISALLPDALERLYEDLSQEAQALLLRVRVPGASDHLIEALDWLRDKVQGYLGKLIPSLVDTVLGRVEGPEYTEISLPLGDDDLLAHEQQYKGRLGAVFYPRYFYGGSNLPGTKPMSTKGVFAFDWLRWVLNDRVAMQYCYEVGIKSNRATYRGVRIAGDDQHYAAYLAGRDGADYAQSFTLALNRGHQAWHQDEAERCSWKDEELLFDWDFMEGKFTRYEYPELLKGGVSAFSLYRVGEGAFVAPSVVLEEVDACAAPTALRADGKRLVADGFDWDTPVELATVVSCAAVESEKYQQLQQRWTTLPYSLQLVENSTTESGGLTVDGQLVYLGTVNVVETSHYRNEQYEAAGIADHEVRVEFTPSDAAEREITASPSLTSLRKRLADPANRAALAMMAGISTGEGGHISRLLTGMERHLFAAVHRFEYTSLTGETVTSIRPFGSNSPTWMLWKDRIEVDSDKTAPFVVALRTMSTAGDSGLKNAELLGAVELELPAPKSYFNDVPWTRMPSDSLAIAQAKQRLEKNNNNAKAGKERPYRMDKLMAWLAQNTEKKKRLAVKKWIEEGVAPMPDEAKAYQ